MAWYDFMNPWRSDSAPDLIDVDPGELPALFRQDSFENAITGQGGPNDFTRANAVRFNQRDYTTSELIQLYRRGGYHRRFIDIVPDDAVRKKWRILERSSDEDAADEILMEEEDKRLKIPTKIADAMRWGRLLGAGSILIVNEDSDLSKPLDVDDPGEILDLIVFDRTEMAPATWNDELGSGHYREVETWWLTPSQVGAEQLTGVVHRSRLVIFGGAKLPPSRKQEEDGFDDSIITAARDQLTNKSVMDNHLSRLAGDARIRVLKLKGLEGKGLGDQRKTLIDRTKLIAQTISIAGVMLLLEGEEFTSQVDSVQGWSTLDDKTRQSLSAVTAIPQTILFGDAPSGLNTDGSSGRMNWADVIVAVQEFQIRDPLEYIYTVLINSMGKQGADWFLEFNKLFEQTALEVADEYKKYAEADTLYINNATYSPEDVARSRFSARGWSPDMKPIDLADVEEREEAVELEMALQGQAITQADDPPEDEPEDEEEEQEDDDRGDAQFLTSWVNEHDHTVKPGSKRTGQNGIIEDKHTHPWIKGSDVTGLGGKNPHIHNVPVDAR